MAAVEELRTICHFQQATIMMNFEIKILAISQQMKWSTGMQALQEATMNRHTLRITLLSSVTIIHS